DSLEEAVSLAAVNGPRAVVVSGSKAAVERVAERFSAQGRRTKRLRVSHAFHSPLIEAMLDEFRRVAQSLDYSPPGLAVISNLSGEPLTEEEACSPDYWVRQARGAVRFADGVAHLERSGLTRTLELGP